MRKPTSGTWGAFFAAVAVAVPIIFYGHALWGDGNAAALWLLILGYGLLGIAILVMVWEHLVRRPTWPTLRSPITWRPDLMPSGPPTGYDNGTVVELAAKRDELQTQIDEFARQNTQLVNDTTIQAGQLSQARAERDEINAQLQDVNRRLMTANAEFVRLRTENEELKAQMAPPPPGPIVPLNNDVIIALNRYGIKACRKLMAVVEGIHSRLGGEAGVVRHLGNLYSYGFGQEYNKAVTDLESRIAAGDSPMPFDAIWEAFHQAYCQGIMWWASVLIQDVPLTPAEAEGLKEWLPLHEKYAERMLDFADGITVPYIKDAVNRRGVGGSFASILGKFTVEPVSSPVPDLGGSSS